MTKYFLHMFLSGKNNEAAGASDMVGVVELHRWEVKADGIRTYYDVKYSGKDCWFPFASGNRFYIVENHGQCQEPNGHIIWRNVDGAQGDDEIFEAAA